MSVPTHRLSILNGQLCIVSCLLCHLEIITHSSDFSHSRLSHDYNRNKHAWLREVLGRRNENDAAGNYLKKIKEPRKLHTETRSFKSMNVVSVDRRKVDCPVQRLTTTNYGTSLEKQFDHEWTVLEIYKHAGEIDVVVREEMCNGRRETRIQKRELCEVETSWHDRDGNKVLIIEADAGCELDSVRYITIKENVTFGSRVVWRVFYYDANINRDSDFDCPRDDTVINDENVTQLEFGSEIMRVSILFYDSTTGKMLFQYDLVTMPIRTILTDASSFESIDIIESDSFMESYSIDFCCAYRFSQVLDKPDRVFHMSDLIR